MNRREPGAEADGLGNRRVRAIGAKSAWPMTRGTDGTTRYRRGHPAWSYGKDISMAKIRIIQRALEVSKTGV
jgi:hypothetical protein